MLLYVMNVNIRIYHPSQSRVYQDEAKMRALQRDKYFWGLEPNQKIIDKTTVHITHAIINI